MQRVTLTAAVNGTFGSGGLSMTLHRSDWQYASDVKVAAGGRLVDIR